MSASITQPRAIENKGKFHFNPVKMLQTEKCDYIPFNMVPFQGAYRFSRGISTNYDFCSCKKSHIRSPGCRMFHVFIIPPRQRPMLFKGFFCFQPFFCAGGSGSIRLKANINDGIHNVLLDVVVVFWSPCIFNKKVCFGMAWKILFVYPRHPNVSWEGIWTPKSKLKYQSSGGMTGWLGLNKKQMKRTLIEISKEPLVQEPYVRQRKGMTCHTFVLTTASFGAFQFYCK